MFSILDVRGILDKPLLFPCRTFPMLHFFMLDFFHVVLFQCCSFFMWHCFHVALFSCCTFPCCTFFMLHFFHVALFSCCTFSMLQSCCSLFSFYVAIFSCCLFIIEKYWKLTEGRKHNQKATLHLAPWTCFTYILIFYNTFLVII